MSRRSRPHRVQIVALHIPKLKQNQYSHTAWLIIHREPVILIAVARVKVPMPQLVYRS
jgi:hypothetical protein